MSSFAGLIEDIPGISIDYFMEDNLQSIIYLLSHCHTDHMHGLERNFFSKLSKTNRYLYCTSISKVILEDTYKPYNPNVIRVLDVHCPETLTYTFNDKEINVTITCIPSGHCPGSVMFILEMDTLSILYTGDFRYNIVDMKKMKIFQSFDGFATRKFNQIHLDTTFLSDLYPKFPSREESVKEFIKVCKEWLDADEKNIVNISTPANYGQEYVYKKVATAFNTNIHVKPRFYQTFVKMGISNYITENSNVRIHDCYSRSGECNVINNAHKYNILTLRLSAKIWTNWDSKLISKKHPKQSNTINICYSSHSSFEELKAFLKHVHCDKVIPSVIPIGLSLIDEATDLINSLITNSTITLEDNTECDIKLISRKKKLYLDSNFKSEYLSSDED